MDLYVKLQGPKHNFEKVQGCFCKITRVGELLELMNYFSKGKGVNRVYAAVNQVHGPNSHGPPASLNRGRWLLDGRLEFNQSEGVCGF
jgi:hypothetical protein